MSVISFRAVPTAESPYPSYFTWISAKDITHLRDLGVFTIDPTYQRGKVSATPKKPARVIHAMQRNRAHIEGIKNDLATHVQSGRSRAIIPPIWANIRWDSSRSTNVSLCAYDENTNRLTFSPNAKAYFVDGWHRMLAITEAYQEGRLDGNRMFCVYFFDGPLSLEAQAFRTLNSTALPVQASRVAWVSAPWSNDLTTVAFDFIRESPHLYNASSEEYNVEVVKNTVSPSSNVLATFMAFVNGFIDQPVGYNVWPVDEVDPSNATVRDMIVEYMVAYWDHLVAHVPEFGFLTPAARITARERKPLIGNVMIQVMVWMAFAYLRAYRSKFLRPTLKQKLNELASDPKRYNYLFKSMNILNSKGKSLFSGSHPLLTGLVRSNHRGFLHNNFQSRRAIAQRVQALLGLDKESSILGEPMKRPSRTSKKKTLKQSTTKR